MIKAPIEESIANANSHASILQKLNASLSDRSRTILLLLVIFAATRLVILGVSLAAYNNFQSENPLLSWGEQIGQLWAKFDVGWYQKIALHGYEEAPFAREVQKSWAFSPLYPLAVKQILRFFTPAHFFVVACIFSSALAIAALHIFSIVYNHTLRSKVRFFFLYLASAGSFYLSIPYTESLALFLMACTWYLTQRRYFLAASLVAGLGAISRVQLLGLIAIPFIPLLLEKKYVKSLTSLLLFSLPVLVHMSYLQNLSGRATAFFDMQYAWGNTNPYPLSSLVAFLLKGFDNGPGQWIHLIFWAVFIFCWIRNWKAIPLNESLFCLAVVLISTACEQFWGAYRYVLLLTPLYVAIANERRWVRDGFIYFNLILATLYIVAFANGKGFVI